MSVIGQKCESQNRCYKKTKHAKCLFFGKFGVLYFLVGPVVRFALLPYCQRFVLPYRILLSKRIIAIGYLAFSPQFFLHVSISFFFLWYLHDWKSPGVFYLFLIYIQGNSPLFSEKIIWDNLSSSIPFKKWHWKMSLYKTIIHLSYPARKTCSFLLIGDFKLVTNIIGAIFRMFSSMFFWITYSEKGFVECFIQ